MERQKLELLSPAKNLECGIAAIDHGADAVYIGAMRYGARAAAGNSVEDIRQLCAYAHQFGARVYVTVNTLFRDDNELHDARQLISELAEAGADAILVQDMTLLSVLSPQDAVALHASTQADNRTAEKVRWLYGQGFSRVVLARELSIREIAEIHRQVPEVELEVFVHGALCVSYSGLCHASEYCFGRSANRGECAQFCRMRFNLLDADGRILERERHLLSLKDLNQSEHLEQLIEAGATSFKIEGRLKDLSYVKNVTAAYSNRLNQIIARHPDLYERASLGRCTYTFHPDLRKTFNRGYTTYFAHGRQPDIASFDTPKATGEPVGTVKELRGVSFTVAGTTAFANGDGLCFINADRELVGFRVNRVEGNRLFPHKMPTGLRPGMRLYRNSDQEMERLLSKPSAERKIPVAMSLRATDRGFALHMTLCAGGHQSLPEAASITVQIEAEHQTAEKPQRENIVRQLTKLGGTPYTCHTVDLPQTFDYFIPSSLLSEMRRQATQQLQTKILQTQTPPQPLPAREGGSHSQGGNAAEELPAPLHYREGLGDSLEGIQQDSPLMQCRHCLRYALGFCVKNGGRRPQWKEPLFLQLGDGRRFRLDFDCRNCQMNVLKIED